MSSIPPPPSSNLKVPPAPGSTEEIASKLASYVEDMGEVPVDVVVQDEAGQQQDIDSFTLRCMSDFEYFCKACLKIKTKADGIQPLAFNVAQLYLFSVVQAQLEMYGKVRIIIVKGRQQGLSTWVQARGYWKTSQHEGVKAYILAHEEPSTKNLFDMAKRYHDHCPPEVKPIAKKSNSKELLFDDLSSEYAVGTAKTGDTGRSQTMQFFHGCLAEGTEVLTPELRIKHIEDFEVGDKVITHTGAIAPISFISQNEKECSEIKIKGHHGTVTASNAHRFITANGKVALEDLAVGDKLLLPIQYKSSLPGPIKFAQPKMKRAQGGGKNEHVPEFVASSYEWGRVLGLYLAEGCIIRQYASRKEPCAVCFAVHRKEVNRTVKWLKAIGEENYTSITANNRTDSLTSTVMVYGKSFAMFIEKQCGSKDSKHTQSNMLKLEECARGALQGYISGDGHFETLTRRVSATSIREAITYGMRDIAAALGYGWASIAFKPAATRHGRKERNAWTFRLTGLGVDKLAKEMGETTAPRKRQGNYGDTKILELKGHKYAEVKILSIKPVGNRLVYDFEVDHPDHSYCLPQCSSSNSEVAYWQAADEISSGVMEGIPDAAGTEVYLESTAAGPGGFFHNQWQNACFPGDTPPQMWNGYWRVFIPWYWQDEYQTDVPKGFSATDEEKELARLYDWNMEQIVWRRQKISKHKGDVRRFQRDYPNTAAEAFNSAQTNILIEPLLVVQAQKNFEEEKYVPQGGIILGVDVAREGDDDTALVMRQGRVMLGYRRLSKYDTIAVANAIAYTLSQYPIEKVVLDVTGGYGGGVYDVLVNRGYGAKTIGINFQERALDEERFKNRRAEMYWKMKEWLERGASIPKSDELLVELTAITYKHDSTYERLQLERKSEIKKRIGKSTDISDAAALTFCVQTTNMGESLQSFNPMDTFGVV